MKTKTSSSPVSFKTADEFIAWAIEMKGSTVGRSGSTQIDAQITLQHKTGAISDEQLKRYQQA